MARDFWNMIMQVPESLTDSDREQLISTYEEYGKELIFVEAEKRKVLPFLAHAIASVGVDVEYWHSVHDKYMNRNKKVLQILDWVFKAFKENGCTSPCVTENFGALLSADSCLACFCSGDVDISADYSEAKQIRSTLVKIGMHQEVRKNYHAELEQDEFRCPDEWMKDFYINIVWLPVIREKAYTLDQRKIIQWLEEERQNAVLYKGGFIRILRYESMLIHCIFHLSAGHYYLASPGIRLFTEIDRIIRNYQIDWGTLIKTVKQLGIEKRVFTSLYLSNRILETPISQEVLGEVCNTKAIRKLADMLYQDKNGVYVVHEPLRLTERLYVDLLSDSNALVIAVLKKVLYAIRYCIRKD